MQADYRYIVVEGPIGSGKSPLSRKLAEHFGCTLISEQPEQNPFLEQFYLNAANHGLAAAPKRSTSSPQPTKSATPTTACSAW